MFIRSLSEGPGRMGTEFAEVLWGNDTIYNLKGYCEETGTNRSNKGTIDLFFKFFENQFPYLLGFIIVTIFLIFGLQPPETYEQ
jgi:hypothetical protein